MGTLQIAILVGNRPLRTASLAGMSYTYRVIHVPLTKCIKNLSHGVLPAGSWGQAAECYARLLDLADAAPTEDPIKVRVSGKLTVHDLGRLLLRPPRLGLALFRCPAPCQSSCGVARGAPLVVSGVSASCTGQHRPSRNRFCPTKRHCSASRW